MACRICHVHRPKLARYAAITRREHSTVLRVVDARGIVLVDDRLRVALERWPPDDVLGAHTIDHVAPVRKQHRTLVEIENRETLTPRGSGRVSPSTNTSLDPSGENAGAIMAVVPRPHAFEESAETSTGDAPTLVGTLMIAYGIPVPRSPALRKG